MGYDEIDGMCIYVRTWHTLLEAQGRLIDCIKRRQILLPRYC